jgi:hypothetical protein
MPLKPQDIMVVLKLCTYERKRPPMSIIAADLNMSPSEIHAAIKRLQKARLLPGPEMQEKPNLTALEEFLLHGVKYAFPAEHGQVTRGLPTSFAAPPLKDEIASGDELPPVWPWRDGETRGIALEPLYKTAPQGPFVIRFSTNCSPWSTQSGMGVHASEKSQKNT